MCARLLGSSIEPSEPVYEGRLVAVASNRDLIVSASRHHLSYAVHPSLGQSKRKTHPNWLINLHFFSATLDFSSAGAATSAAHQPPAPAQAQLRTHGGHICTRLVPAWPSCASSPSGLQPSERTNIARRVISIPAQPNEDSQREIRCRQGDRRRDRR